MRDDLRNAPLYVQLFEALRARIRSGELDVGQQLPTEDQLQAQYAVGRNTVRAALDKLVRAGLISRQAGRGTFVTRRDSRITGWSISNVDDLIDLSFSSYRVLSAGPVPATRHPAPALFEAGPDDQLFLVHRVSIGPDGPYASAQTWFPHAIGSRLSVAEMSSRPLLKMVEELGLRIVRAEQLAAAEAASPETASELDLPAGAPVLVLERTYFDEQGRALEQARVSHRSDRYAQSVTFSRGEV